MRMVTSVREFVRELRRRRVVRVMLVYVVVGWAIVEVAVTLEQALDLPSWTDSFVVLMALIGFPLAIILAWAYDVTPDGVRRTEAEPSGPASTTPPARSSLSGTVRPPSLRRPQPRRETARALPPESPAVPAGPEELRRAMLATLRHELRTPLNAVIGYSEILLEDAPTEGSPPLRSILTSGKRILALVDEILRPDASGEALTDEALTEMRRRVREELSAPAARLVELCASAAPAAGAEGAAAEELERMAEAATRLRELVQLETSALASDERGGISSGPTRELAARVIAGLPRPGVPAPDAPPKHGQILVVDDNETNRDLLSRQLSRQGFSVSLAGDGEAALEALRMHDFDLVLLDILMPGLDGIEVLVQMQRDPAMADVPVIMTSALDEIEGVVRCIERGAVDYLTKPFDPVLLQARVGATLDLHRLRAQQRRAAQDLDAEVAWSERLTRSLVPEHFTERVRERRGSLIEAHDQVTALALFIHGLGPFATRHGTAVLRDWLTDTIEVFEGILREIPVEVHWEAGATLIASTGTHPAREAEPARIAELALRLRDEGVRRVGGADPIRIGIGMHTGPAVAGFVDAERVAFGLWGEAPDVARELAWRCPTGEAQVSPAAYAALHGSFAFEGRGMIETSFRSQMRVYELVGPREAPTAEAR